MQLEDLRIFKPSSGQGPFTTVAAALAGATTPSGVGLPYSQGAVVVAPDYAGSDYNTFFTSASASTGQVAQTVLDLRPLGARSGALATAQLTGIAANTTAANFSSVIPPAGLYAIDWYIVVTTVFTTTGPNITFGWTDAKQAQTLAATAASTAAGSFAQGRTIIQSTGAAQITWLVTTTGTYGLANAYMTLTRLV